MSAVSVFRFAARKYRKIYFVVVNPNTETADKVGSFRTLIIGSETGKKCVLQLIIQIRKLPTISAVSVFRLSALVNKKKCVLL